MDTSVSQKIANNASQQIITMDTAVSFSASHNIPFRPLAVAQPTMSRFKILLAALPKIDIPKKEKEGVTLTE